MTQAVRSAGADSKKRHPIASFLRKMVEIVLFAVLVFFVANGMRWAALQVVALVLLFGYAIDPLWVLAVLAAILFTTIVLAK